MAPQSLASLAKIDEITETDIAYIAGLIDADGTVTANSGARRKDGTAGHPIAMVLIVNGNLDLIVWLKKTIGLGCAYETKTRPTRPDQNEANWNKVHRYQIIGAGAVKLLRRCRPFMRVKGRQADVCFTMPMKGVHFLRNASQSQRAAALDALRAIRGLNHRGKAA